jgi:hypothetical protein
MLLYEPGLYLVGSTQHVEFNFFSDVFTFRHHKFVLLPSINKYAYRTSKGTNFFKRAAKRHDVENDYGVFPADWA